HRAEPAVPFRYRTDIVEHRHGVRLGLLRVSLIVMRWRRQHTSNLRKIDVILRQFKQLETQKCLDLNPKIRNPELVCSRAILARIMGTAMGIRTRLALLCATAAVAPVGAAQAQDWTGLYVGANASSTLLDMDGTFRDPVSGTRIFSFEEKMATYGGALAYLHQVDRFVLGGELSIESGFEKPSFLCTDRRSNLGSYFGYGYDCGVDYSGSVAATVSASYLIVDSVGLYAEAGVSMSSLSVRYTYEWRETANLLPGDPYIRTGTIDMKDDLVGFTWGLGARYKPSDRLMVEFEYSVVDYPDFDVAGTEQRTYRQPGGQPVASSFPVDLGSVDVYNSAFKLGLKYRL
ncbi:MAG: porin family protein, partial [Burkholderiales bacterium]